jgi:hypothetical protein
MTVLKDSAVEVLSELTPYSTGIGLVVLVITPYIF